MKKKVVPFIPLTDGIDEHLTLVIACVIKIEETDKARIVSFGKIQATPVYRSTYYERRMRLSYKTRQPDGTLSEVKAQVTLIRVKNVWKASSWLNLG